MIQLNDIMTDTQKAILTVFEPALIAKKQKDLDNFNKKTKNFLESIKTIKIDL